MGQPQRCRSLFWYVHVSVLSEFRSRLMSHHRCFRIYLTLRLFMFVFLNSSCFLHGPPPIAQLDRACTSLFKGRPEMRRNCDH